MDKRQNKQQLCEQIGQRKALADEGEGGRARQRGMLERHMGASARAGEREEGRKGSVSGIFYAGDSWFI